MPNRRDFLKKTMLTSAMLSSTTATFAAPAATHFKLLYAPHLGMFKNSAGDDPIAQLEFMAAQGFRAMEDNGMMGRDVALQKKIGETMARFGMKMGVFVINFDGWPPHITLTSGNEEWKEKFLKTCHDAVEVAKRVNAKFMTVVPGNFDRTLPMGIQTAHVIDVLRQACAIFEPHQLTMVLEPLSDNPDLFLRHSDQAYMICKAVNSSSCKILFDMWHMQRNEGQLTKHIDLVWDEIGYFQIGDEPGRNEPTTGEINYKFLFQHIYSKAKAEGKEFILGMEHGNAFAGKAGETKLIEAYKWSDSF